MFYILTAFPHTLPYLILMKFLIASIMVMQENGQVCVRENESVKVTYLETYKGYLFL